MKKFINNHFFEVIVLMIIVSISTTLLTIIKKYEEPLNYDVNKDGEVDLMDLYELREYLLEEGD